MPREVVEGMVTGDDGDRMRVKALGDGPLGGWMSGRDFDEKGTECWMWG